MPMIKVRNIINTDMAKSNRAVVKILTLSQEGGGRGIVAPQPHHPIRIFPRAVYAFWPKTDIRSIYTLFVQIPMKSICEKKNQKIGCNHPLPPCSEGEGVAAKIYKFS